MRVAFNKGGKRGGKWQAERAARKAVHDQQLPKTTNKQANDNLKGRELLAAFITDLIEPRKQNQSRHKTKINKLRNTVLVFGYHYIAMAWRQATV